MFKNKSIKELFELQNVIDVQIKFKTNNLSFWNEQAEIMGFLEKQKELEEINNNLELKTLFTQLMLEKDFLATTAFYASYAHEEYHITKYLTAVDDVFKILKEAIIHL